MFSRLNFHIAEVLKLSEGPSSEGEEAVGPLVGGGGGV
jgi:hypothetical protein